MINVDVQAAKRDRRWFAAHRGRRTLIRYPSELEEIEIRRHFPSDDYSPVVIVRRIPGGRAKQVLRVPNPDGREIRLPADRETVEKIGADGGRCLIAFAPDGLEIMGASE